MIKITNKGNWERTEKFFKKSIKLTKIEGITSIMEDCIERLKEATPKNSGITSESWSYEITKTKNKKSIYINNSNIQNGINIAFLLEVGHMTVNGHWVEGKEYIEPITLDIYNKILNNVWKEMKRL